MNRENVMKIGCFIAASLSIISVALISIFLLAEGIPAIHEIGFSRFIFGRVWRPGSEEFGILPMIIGSIYVTGLAILFGVPIGVLSAVFLSYYAGRRSYAFIKPMMELLAGIPSIVYGLFGLVVIVPMMQRIFPGTSGKSVLTAALLLSFMILPTIITVSETSIRAVDESVYHGALALGATKEISIFTVSLAAAKSGVVSSIVLGIGRAIGETMAVIMIAGNQAVIPKSLLSGVRTMTANIVLEMGYAADLHRGALIATGVVLFVFIMMINLSFSALRSRRQ